MAATITASRARLTVDQVNEIAWLPCSREMSVFLGRPEQAQRAAAGPPARPSPAPPSPGGPAPALLAPKAHSSAVPLWSAEVQRSQAATVQAGAASERARGTGGRQAARGAA